MVTSASARAIDGARHTHEVVIGPDSITAVEVLTGTPGAIVPDAANTAGVANSLTLSDHGHAAPCAVPAALTKTGTAAEGAGNDFARATHVHPTDALPWGIVARQSATATDLNTVNAGTELDTDMVLTPTVDVSRLYVVCLHTELNLTVAAATTVGITVKFTVGGVDTARFWRESDFDGSGNDTIQIESRFPWEPASGTPTIRVRVRNDSGSNRNIDLIATATSPRWFWVEDIGPR